MCFYRRMYICMYIYMYMYMYVNSLLYLHSYVGLGHEGLGFGTSRQVIKVLGGMRFLQYPTQARLLNTMQVPEVFD